MPLPRLAFLLVAALPLLARAGDLETCQGFKGKGDVDDIAQVCVRALQSLTADLRGADEEKAAAANKIASRLILRASSIESTVMEENLATNLHNASAAFEAARQQYQTREPVTSDGPAKPDDVDQPPDPKDAFLLPPAQTPPEKPGDLNRAAAQLSPDQKAEVGGQLQQQVKQLESSGKGAPSAFAGLGEKFLALGRPTDALRSLDRAVALDGGSARDFADRAQARLMAGDRAGASDDARRALALDPNDPMSRLIAGNSAALDQAAQKVKAGKLDFGAAPDADAPGRAGALGTAALAGAVLPQSPQGSSAAFQALAQRAYRKMQMGDYLGALVEAGAAVDAEPKNAAAWVLRSEIDNQLKNYKAAAEDAGNALALEPANPQALRAKAYAELQSGDYDRALADVERALSLDPGAGVGYMYRAMIEEKLGRTADALKDYDKADDLDSSLTPLTVDAFRRLGAGYDTTTGKATGKAASPAAPVARLLLRGGAAAAAAALIAVGLLGAFAGKKLTTTAKRLLGRAGAQEATVLDAPSREVGPGVLLGGNYRVTAELGRGGMGVVYDALDEALQRRVAVKQLQRDERTTSADLERFLKEARLVAQLKHPNLAEIYSVVDEGELYLVFEFVDGKPLDQVLDQAKRLSLPQARRLLAEVCSALQYAHQRQIIHRDLKPSNIMISKEGSAKVMDFGIAHQSSAGATALTRTSASGTPPYMAPEQALGSVSKASDLYALAAMAYEVLTGVRPFEGPDFLEQKLRKSYLAPSRRDPSLPRELDAFFARAFDPDPTKRAASAEELCRDFEAACAGPA